jgi:hypothetical protein
MKKEGLLIVVLAVFLILLPTVRSEISQVILINFTEDTTDDPYISECVGGTDKDVVSCSVCGAAHCPDSGSECALYSGGDGVPAGSITFNLEKPVLGGVLEFVGGELIWCDLNGQRVGTYQQPNSCHARGRAFIPPGTFKMGQNVLACRAVGGGTHRHTGLRILHFSYVVDMDDNKDACINAGNSFRDELKATDQACCGDDPEDLGRVSVVGTGAAKQSWLCGKTGDAPQWHLASQNSWRIKNFDTFDAVSNSENWFVCNSTKVGVLPPVLTNEFIDIARASKFACVDQGKESRFVECCDPLRAGNDPRACQNTDLKRGFGRAFPGDPTTRITENVQARTFTNSPQNFDITALSIRNWSSFHELDVVFNVSEDYHVFIELLDPQGQPLLSKLLSDFVVNTPTLNQFMVARVPLPTLSSSISTIRFRYERLHDVPGRAVNNVLTIDRMYLVPNSGNLFYCSGESYLGGFFEAPWIEDLDNNVLGRDAQPVGKSACSAIPSFRWTGTQCCGDDNYRYSKEYYNDTEAGCWNGNGVNESTSLSEIFLNTSSNLEAFSCRSTNCSYPLPLSLPALIANPLNDSYKLSVVEPNADLTLGSEATTITRRGLFHASGIKQSILFTRGQFFSCFPNPFTANQSSKLSCSIRKDCTPQEIKIADLSSKSNAHASGENSVCCGGILGLGNSCSGNHVELAYKSSENSAHLVSENVNDDNPICLSAPRGADIDCLTSETSPGAGYTCLFSSSSETNAHIAACDMYSLNVYCKIKTPGFINPTVPVCSVFGGSFCSPDVGWTSLAESRYTDLSGKEIIFPPSQRNTEKDATALGTSSFSCCPVNACWNGTVCVQDQTNVSDHRFVEIYNGNRCIAGDWTGTPLVFTRDKKEQGYCPSIGQCLVDKEGDPALNGRADLYVEGKIPRCINSGQYILDDICDAGNWTTRTRLIALELMDLVNRTGDTSNYTLFCDDYNRTLVDSSSAINSILGPLFSPLGTRACFQTEEPIPCANNFCVLEFTSGSSVKKVVGVSLNRAIHDTSSGILAGLGLSASHCGSLAGSGDFKKCSNDNKIWHNPQLNATIYSREGIDLDAPAMGWFRSFFSRLINLFSGSSSSSPDTTFITNSSQFNRVYLASRPTREIRGFQETIGEEKFFLVKYTNYPANLCTYLQNKAQASPLDPGVSNIICISQGNETTVFSHDPAAMNLWQDLTSKLRIS